jgi:hypothetical protein
LQIFLHAKCKKYLAILTQNTATQNQHNREIFKKTAIILAKSGRNCRKVIKLDKNK